MSVPKFCSTSRKAKIYISIIKKKNPDLPVIAITGWGELPETLAAEAQADLVMGKPLVLSKLDDFITDILSGKSDMPKQPG